MQQLPKLYFVLQHTSNKRIEDRHDIHCSYTQLFMLVLKKHIIGFKMRYKLYGSVIAKRFFLVIFKHICVSNS